MCIHSFWYCFTLLQRLFYKKIIFFLRKVWWLLFFVIPLHSLLRQAVYLLFVYKASFFEKIYIDREVVQEASVAIKYSIRWLKETS